MRGRTRCWNCRCSCGAERVVRGIHLLSGHTRSCGCAAIGSHGIDLVGRKFGRLTVIALASNASRVGNKKRGWHCRCDCGGEATVSGSNLGRCTFSCGCIQAETRRATGAKSRTHGMRYTPEYHVWVSMLDRCRNPNNPAWSRYGGRGICVCESWYRFENFIADMGRRPSPDLEIDRLDNDGNYEPGNCAWRTRQQNLLNRRPQLRERNGRLLPADVFREIPL